MALKKAALLLLPNVLGDVKHHEPFLPASVDKAVAAIDGLIAESEKEGRRFLSRFSHGKPVHLIPIAVLNKHTKEEDLDFFLEPIRRGERWGLVSDAGLPCIADPGADLVRRARSSGIAIQAFVGPCSFIHALIQSGLPAQQFSFHGYLSSDAEERKGEIQKLEALAGTQIFMETPYRVEALLAELVKELKPSTWLAVAWELTLPEQGILSQPVELFRKSPLPKIDRKNVVFLINSAL